MSLPCYFQILQNDIEAHHPSVDSVNQAGREVISSEGGAVATTTREKLDTLNSGWERVIAKMTDRRGQLEELLREARGFHGDLQDMLQRLAEIDAQLATSQPFGGLPETAKDQLERFMEIFNELEAYNPRVKTLLETGQELVDKSDEAQAQNLKKNLQTLQQRWDNIMSRANDRKHKLEEAAGHANNFHQDLNKVISWLTEIEKNLNNLKPVSRVIDIIQEQIEEHKGLQKEISGQREVMTNLNKTGTHLKYFSQKQDVILIKNLLVSVQHRWEKAVSRSADRSRQLEHGYKEAKQFSDIWKDLCDWLDENDAILGNDLTIGNEPDMIKQQINKHKEFQRALGTKQPQYDTVNRLGRVLKDKCPKADAPVIQSMLTDIKNKWNNVCGKSVDR